MLSLLNLFFSPFFGILMLWGAISPIENFSHRRLNSPEPHSIFHDSTGNLEFRLGNDSLYPEHLQSLVDSALKKDGAKPPYTAQQVAGLNRALRGKIPVDSEILFEYQRDPVTQQVEKAIPYLLERAVPFGGDFLSEAKVTMDQGEPHVLLLLNAEGKKRFAELTTKNVGKHLAIVVDGTVYLSPIIQSPILEGKAQITFGFMDFPTLLATCEDLVAALKRQYHLK